MCRCCAALATTHAADVEIAVKDPLSTKNVWAGAGAAASVGTMSLCLVFLGQFFFVAAPIAVLAAGWTVYYVSTRDDLRERLGFGMWPVLALSVWGGIMGTLAMLFGAYSMLS